MTPRTTSQTNRFTSRSAGSKHGLVTRPVVPDTGVGSVLLLKTRQDLNRFRSNSIHPVAPTAHSLVPRYSTADSENIPTGDVSRDNTAQNYVVKVRVLHGIDLYIPSTNTTCHHAARPVVSIAVSGSPTQSCIAARHGRNHSIWKKHELKFATNGRYQDPAQPGIDEVDGSYSFISMYVSLACVPCSCTTKTNEKVPTSISIGEVGELQFPAKQNEDYEIKRFFPVIRRQQHNNSQPSYILLPAGKIKLCIRVEVEKPIPDSAVAQPEIPKRPPFALPANFGEALQLKRKQLKATVAPEDNSQKASDQQASQLDSLAATTLLEEIAVETARDHILTSDLKIEGRIGEGIHSCVSLGLLRGCNYENSRQVAVKEFRHQHAIPPVNVLRAYQQEYRILERCRDQDGREHVVELVGVTLEPRLLIVMEYFSRGSLAQCLQHEATWAQMSIKQKAKLALKIAQSIAWMHKRNMIHRDIKSHNILIDGDLTTLNPAVKIGDLGSAVLRHQHEPLLLEEVGSSGYTAPEIFTHRGYDSKVDVWSFGIVLWELTSSPSQHRVNPFAGMAGEEFVNKAQSGCRPNLVHEHQVYFQSIVEKCWIFDPLERPSMGVVVNYLDKLWHEL